MVPATMGRKAMAAVLCAIAMCPIAVLMTTQPARADAPIPLGQVAQSDPQPSDGTGSASADASTTSEDQASGSGWLDNASASDWSWSDWFPEDASATPSDATSTDAPPWDAAPSDAASADATPWDTTAPDAAPADATPTDPTLPEAAPADTEAPADTVLAAPTLTAATSALTAPALTVSGTTLSWATAASVSSYVFVRKVPGQADQYSIVSGTSIAPPAVPGQTVNYSVRTNVGGSSWAPEVSIAYPASSTPTPPTSPTPPPSSTPQPVDGTFQMGVVAGSALSYELPFVEKLGAHTARMEFSADTSASSMASTIDAYAKAGIRPMLLATFPAGMPTSAEAQNVGTWAAAYGPGGSFWQGKSYPANTAVTDIEFGNETSYSYQFSDNSLATYSSRAQTYALRAADAANAIRAANPKVGLLAQGDDAVNGTAWVTSMLEAVPNLADLVAGWTIHPYGPSWATRIDSTIDAAKAAGARDLPIWVTEWGLSTDNGRCLDDNYGYDTCMTYASAASTLHSALAGMESRYGSRLGAFFLYQAHDQYASGTQTGREAYFGALQSNGAAKGAYTTEAMADLAVN